MEDPASEGLPSELVSAVDAGAFLADVLEHSPVPYALFGLDGHPVFTNPAYRSMFGSAPPPEYNLLTDDLLTRVGLADPVHRAYAGERVQAPVVWYDPTQLTQVPVPAGVRRAAIACTLFPVRNSERRITHVAVAYRDVTAEMDAEARASAATTEAHFSEQRYRLIAEAANDGLWFWNLQNDRVDWNPRLLDLLGLQRPRGESRLHHVLDRVHPDDQPRMRAALEAHLQRRERYELEVRVLHADGGWRVWLCRGQATWGIDGKATFMAGSATDVTEQKRVAEGQQRQTAELREAIQARDTFLSVASHELKTPLTPLALRLAQLTREVGGKGGERIDRSRALRSLEIAAAQVKKLATLVDGLLDVSRLAQGRLALTEDEVDLVEIVRGAAEALRPQAERAGSPLTLDASGRAVGRLDRARVKQVVTHLVSNAIKFGAGLPVEISLSVRAGWATVTVKDQGIGIAPDALERIFQRFERGVSERHYGGLGLGLYLTRQSVEAMGGTVKAQGEPGRGAAFTVELPLFREEAWVERPKLHDLFAQVPIAVCILEGPQYTFTFANRAYLAMVGGRDVIGKPAKEALPELQGHGFDVLLGRVMATGEPFVGSELPVRLAHHAQGEKAFFNFVYSPKRNARGEVDGVVVSASDVTETVLTRQRMQESGERLRLVIDAVPDLINFVDVEGRYQLTNRAYESWFGKSMDELRGKTVRDVVGEENFRCLEPFMERALGGERVTWETPFVFREGRRGFIEGTFVPQRDGAGAVTGYVSLISDISDRRQTEVVKREQAEFEQQLIGIVSHDLRNPLNAILLGVAALTRRGALDPPGSKLVLRIRSSAERAVRMVKDLLDFTQARLGGGIPVRPVPVDLHALVSQVVEEVETAYPGRNVEVRQAGDAQGLWDGDRIAQAVGNLVTNALKYGAEGSPIRISTRGEEGWAAISVHNTGAPIPPEKLPSIFEPFHRAGADVDRAGRSVGLGLYIVKRIVDVHGGTVEVVSNPHDGTTFRVRLPRDRSAPHPAPN